MPIKTIVLFYFASISPKISHHLSGIMKHSGSCGQNSRLGRRIISQKTSVQSKIQQQKQTPFLILQFMSQNCYWKFQDAESLLKVLQQYLMNTYKKKNPPVFLVNTHIMLEKPELSHIVSWGPSGKGFIIHDQPKFEAEVLSRFFNHQKFTSFVRQLNMYGFYKQRDIEYQNYFQHDTFSKDEGLKLIEIKRKPQKKKKSGENVEMHIISNQDIKVRSLQTVEGEPESNGQISQERIQFMPRQYSKKQVGKGIQQPKPSLTYLCEQAVFQNQALNKVHGLLMKQTLKLKKFRFHDLRNEMNYFEPCLVGEKEEARESMAFLCDLMKTQTQKLLSGVDVEDV